jgi:hypothetical protein
MRAPISFRQCLARILALPASLGTPLGVRHVGTRIALSSALLASLFTDLAHLPGKRRVVFHHRHARSAGLYAGQARLVACRAATVHQAFPAGPQALVTGFDAVLFGDGVHFGLGSLR